MHAPVEGDEAGSPAASNTPAAGVTAANRSQKLGICLSCSPNFEACRLYSWTSKYSCSVILSESDMPVSLPAFVEVCVRACVHIRICECQYACVLWACTLCKNSSCLPLIASNSTAQHHTTHGTPLTFRFPRPCLLQTFQTGLSLAHGREQLNGQILCILG